MDYHKVYNALISFRKSNPLEKSDSTYTEVHHILPRCMGGSNDPVNLVRLTVREHFIAHRLLTKIYPESKGASLAVLLMQRQMYGMVSSSKEFERLRRIASLRLKEQWADETRKERISKLISKSTRSKWKGDQRRKEAASERMSTQMKLLWKRRKEDEIRNEVISSRLSEAGNRFYENNPWPWQRPAARKTKHIWTLAATFYEMYNDDSLIRRGKRYDYFRFSSEFLGGLYENIFYRMQNMFKESWNPLECNAYLEEFGEKI